MKFLTGISICILLFSISGHTQTIDIGFDSSGKMVKFPPPVIRPCAKLQFTITTPKEFVHNQLTTFSDRLKKAIDFENKNPDPVFFCIFGITSAKYDSVLNADLNYIQKLGFCNRPDPAIIKLLDTASLVPLTKYLYSVYDSAFEVKITRGNTVIDSVWLKFIPNNCKSTCLTFQSKLDKNIHDLTTLKCPSCSIDSLSFQLIYHNPFNNTIVDLFKTHYSDLQDFHPDVFITDFQPFAATETLDSTQCEKYKTARLDFFKLNRWLKTWLWYTGKMTLNPFPVAGSIRQKQIKDSIDHFATEMTTTVELEHYVDSAKVKMWPTDRHYPIFEHLIARGLTLKQLYSTDSIILVNLKNEQDQEFASIDKLARTSSYIYGGKLMVSKSGRLVVQKQFDALDFLQPIYKSRPQLERITNLPENERLVLMVQNTDSNAFYTATEKTATVNDLETFTLQVTNALSAASVNTASTAQYTNFGNDISALFRKYYSGTGGYGVDIAPVEKDFTKKQPCNCSEELPILKAAYDSLIKDSAAKFTNLLPGSGLFQPQPLGKAINSTVVLRTYLYFHSKAAPYYDTVLIKNTIKKDSVYTYFQVSSALPHLPTGSRRRIL